MNGEGDGDETSFLSTVLNPSTMSHLMILLLNTGFLYTLMRYEAGYIGTNGSTIFLSLSISYMVTAIIISSKFGQKIFLTKDDGDGIFTRKYFIRALISLVPIIIFTTSLIIFLNGLFEIKNINYFMSSLFILLSIGQGISLVFGSVIFIRKKESFNQSKTSKQNIIVRTTILITVFIPLVWWFGYGAENVGESNIKTHILWFLFFLVITIISYFVNTLTSDIRRKLGNKGRRGDLLMNVLIFAYTWHIFSAWRRNTWLVDSVDGLMLIEEGLLMIITILLAVTSMINRGKKRGVDIFGGSSAIFWGISFGYLYAGSISSLTILSEQLTESSLLQTTSLGHIITAGVIILILPFAIKKLDHDEEE
jgi:hypothetical protein